MRLLNTAIRAVLAALILLTLLMLAACPQQHSVAELVNDPGRYADRDVAIKGTVTQAFGALGTGMYQVDDGTGKIWVYSQNRAVPAKNTRVGVAGRIQPTFMFAGKSFATVLRETDRRR